MKVAVTWLPPLFVALVFTGAALALAPEAPAEPALQHTICLELPAKQTASLVISAVAQAHGDLEGCFAEWNERALGDADMLVRMTVGADGIGHSSQIAAGPDSPMLRLCVAEAIGRVKFPRGPEALDLDVFVIWSAGMVSIAPRVTARRKMLPTTVDLGVLR